ncbi:MAG: GNAT family N-acetyltransferase [Eubacteriales bacterium]|nr:GNAT family N-acetyltransferase [Eubacteriales bacterium]
MIRHYEPRDFSALHRLWNTAGVRQGYVPATEPELEALLTGHIWFSQRFAFVLEQAGALAGFVCGCAGDELPQGQRRGYFTCLLLDERWETEDNARLLLTALEDAFRREGKTQLASTFFNPIHLPWVIPGTQGHQHNNCPGVARDLPLHGWMVAMGYQVCAGECAMYLDLKNFRLPRSYEEKRLRAGQEGYSIAWYDDRLHTGLDDMVHAMGNPMWSQEIPVAARTVNMLVALYGNRVAGFTGPVYPEPTGRGYFAGIAVAKEHEKHGLGTLLFCRLCQAEQEAGSRYMSLFTGEDNHAQKIYLSAGFTVRRIFSVMTKEL